MPRKRGLARKSSSQRRRKKFQTSYSKHTVPLRYKKTLPEGSAKVEYWLLQQEWLEQQVLPVLDTYAVPSEQREYYLNFARRKRKVGQNFTGLTREDEFTSLHNEFVLRGLNASVLDAIQVVLPKEAVWILGYSRLGVDTRLA